MLAFKIKHDRFPHINMNINNFLYTGESTRCNLYLEEKIRILKEKNQILA